jgi:broad specificity phosphatase PhoE
VLCRHAESLLNVARGTSPHTPPEAKALFAGMHDRHVPLTENGHVQSRQASVRLRDRLRSLDVAYHSDTVRGRDTAANLVLAFSHVGEVPLRETYLINERDPGYTFGMTREESAHVFPFLNDYWKRVGWFYARPPGGESVHDVAVNRVPLFLRMLDERYEGKRILVVTHGRWIQAARIVLENLPTEPEIPHGRNCGWIEYRNNWNTNRLELHDIRNYA